MRDTTEPIRRWPWYVPRWNLLTLMLLTLIVGARLGYRQQADRAAKLQSEVEFKQAVVAGLEPFQLAQFQVRLALPTKLGGSAFALHIPPGSNHIVRLALGDFQNGKFPTDAHAIHELAPGEHRLEIVITPLENRAAALDVYCDGLEIHQEETPKNWIPVGKMITRHLSHPGISERTSPAGWPLELVRWHHPDYSLPKQPSNGVLLWLE